jgi:pentatricopeptide repeat protein
MSVPYTSVIDGCTEAGQWKKAIELLHDMIQVDDTMPTVFMDSALTRQYSWITISASLKTSTSVSMVERFPPTAVSSLKKPPGPTLRSNHFPKVTDLFADFPYLHSSIDQRLLTLE